MNTQLLKSQFLRLASNPTDTRLLKQLAVELGSGILNRNAEWLREYRIFVAEVLRTWGDRSGEQIEYARGVLDGLFDVAAVAEATKTYLDELTTSGTGAGGEM